MTSVLSSSSSDTSETVSQCESIDLPPLSSPAGLRVAHLNCRSLLSVADEVFDLFTHNCMDVLLLLRHGWTLQLMIMRYFLTPQLSVLYKMIKIVMVVGVAFLLSSRVKFVVRFDLCEGHIESLWIELFPKSKRSML